MKHKIIQTRLFAVLLALPALLTAARAQTQLTGSYTNSFPTADNTSQFTGGSVASWIYWYGLGYSNTKMTNDPTMDAAGQTNTSGSLMVYLPFGSSGDQGVFFGTFDNGYGYDNSVTINARNYTNLAFDILFAPGTPLNAAGNLGSITMSIFPGSEGGGDFSLFSGVTIPASARTNWYHAVESITNFLANEPTAGVTNCDGMGFDYNSYGGYPTNPVTFWLDNVSVISSGAPAPPPPAPTLAAPRPAQAGLNLFTTSASSQYNRYSLVTANDTGYSFAGQSNVTYSWNVASFPGQAYSGYQQHLFLIPASQTSAVNTENAADYSEPDAIFITLQYNSSVTAASVTNGSTVSTNSVTNWYGELEFRYKTNEPNGNAMIFNGASPTNTATNPNAWPVEPVGDVRSPTATGTWSVTFNATTNVILTAPNGSNTTFTLPAASAQLFADPLYVFLGVQPNNVSAEGQATVLNNFSITGAQTPFSDNFITDTALSANWTLDSADTNAVQFVAAGTFLLNWTAPADGFDLQMAGMLSPTNTLWTFLTGPNATNPATAFRNLAQETILISPTNLPASNQTYYQLIQDQ
jgi:hypothetical protein